MKNDYTHLTICLDRSGSMETVRDGTLEGLNKLIQEQRVLPGKCTLTLVQFDHHNNRVCVSAITENQDIRSVAPLTRDNYEPRGGTPLYDAVADCINHTGKFLKSMPEAERPAKVIFAIVTDGFENSSATFTREGVFGMVKHQQDVYRWEFLFIGANQDAYLTGAGIGVPQSHSLNYTANAVGTNAVYACASSNLRKLRTDVAAGNMTASMDWSDEDRKKQDEAKS